MYRAGVTINADKSFTLADQESKAIEYCQKVICSYNIIHNTILFYWNGIHPMHVMLSAICRTKYT